MNAYELIRHLNSELVKGTAFTAAEKKEATTRLLAGADSREKAERFRQGVKAPDDGRILYPLFYIPPYNGGKKLRLFTGELPKTHILSANHYELEVLRLLALWDKDNPIVTRMLDETVRRLETTCFARFCSLGDCVGAGVATLRFLTALRTGQEEWINKLLPPLMGLFRQNDKNMPVYYFYAAMVEIANDACRAMAAEKEEWLVHMLRRGCLTGPAAADTYNPTRLYVLRNTLMLLPAYAYLADKPVYVAGKDNRCYCDV